jgi:hypothetical protein
MADARPHLDIFSHVESVLIDGREVFNEKDYR